MKVQSFKPLGVMSSNSVISCSSFCFIFREVWSRRWETHHYRRCRGESCLHLREAGVCAPHRNLLEDTEWFLPNQNVWFISPDIKHQGLGCRCLWVLREQLTISGQVRGHSADRQRWVSFKYATPHVTDRPLFIASNYATEGRITYIHGSTFILTSEIWVDRN